MTSSAQLVTKTRNRLIVWWALTPLILVVVALISPADAEIGLIGAFVALVLGISCLVYNGVFLYRVWCSPLREADDGEMRQVQFISVLLLIGIIGAQFIPTTSSIGDGASDAFVPLWVSTTTRGWGLPFCIIREIHPILGVGYSSRLIDFGALLFNLLLGVFLFFLLHCWLHSRWSKRSQPQTPNGQQDGGGNRGGG